MNAILLAAGVLLAAEAAAGGARARVPEVGATRREAADEDFTQSASRTTAVALARDAGDAIDDSSLPQRRIPGVELFVTRLDEALREGGVDHPRYRILKNAERGWEALERGYDALRPAFDPLAESRDLLDEIIAGARELLDENGRSVERIRSSSDEIGELVAAMSADPPRQSGREAEPRRVEGVDESADRQKERIAELNARLDLARALVQQAQGPIEAAAGYPALGAAAAEEAGSLDGAAYARVTANRAAGAREASSAPLNSQRVLAMASGRLEAAVAQARKAKALADRLTAPDGPIAAALKAGRSAGKAAKGGCAACGKGAAQANADGAKLAGLEKAYAAAKTPEERQRISEQAREALDSAQRAGKSAGKGADGAAAADAQARALLDRAAALLARLRQQELGDEARGQIASELTALSTPRTRAPEPSSGPAVRAGKAGRVRSRPIKYPEALGLPTETISRYEFGAASTLDGKRR